jgi:hypothetical protein
MSSPEEIARKAQILIEGDTKEMAKEISYIVGNLTLNNLKNRKMYWRRHCSTRWLFNRNNCMENNGGY